MSFWREIADKLGKDELLKTLNQSQCEAIIDALNLLVYADGEESLLERAELEHLLHDLPWVLSEGDKVASYRAESATRHKQAAARGKQGLLEAAQEIAARLEGVKLRKKALKMAAAVAYADWNAGKHEHDALLALARAFEIPDPFARAMIADIEAENTGVAFLDEPTEPELVPLAAERSIREVLSTSFLQGFFLNLFADESLRHLSHDAAMAFVDALAIALVADGYPEQEELREFKSQLEQLPFSKEQAIEVKHRVEGCLTTLRQTPDAELDAFIDAVAARIPSESLKERALIMAVHITHADLDITHEEHRMLHRIARGFGISADRLDTLIQDIKEDTEEGFITS